jgi:hypothetical protein
LSAGTGGVDKPCEFCELQGLRSPSWIDLRRRQEPAGIPSNRFRERAYGIQQHLSALHEERANETLEQSPVRDPDRRRTERQAHDSGSNLGGGPEGARWKREEPLDVSRDGRQDGQHAVFVRPNLRRQSRGDLELQHDGCVNEPAGPSCLKKLEKDGRGNVVGEIACDAERFVPRELHQITREYVPLDDRRVRKIGLPKARHQIAIDFNRNQARHAGGEASCERARTRTDFNKSIGRRWRDRVDDLVGPRGFQKMLAEALAYGRPPRYACSIDSPRQNFSSISSISSSLIPK